MPDLLGRIREALKGRYSIERELGQGGMSVVYLARDEKHDRQVAIKVLRRDIAAALGPERFLQEIQIAARLQHPHIVPLYDSGVADGALYYVMPNVEGESLRERLKRETQLPIDEALAITRQVAQALSYAHSHGVVHRDIKPANILLTGGEAVVADFGIARALSVATAQRLTTSGIAIGTPTYMSPEQGSGVESIDGRSDQYSLGCVLYEMLSGDPPFTGPTMQMVIARHMSEQVPSLRVVRPSVSHGLQAVIETALAKVPADRFATANDFIDALDRAEQFAIRRRSTVVRRHPILAAVVALLLVAAGWVGLSGLPSATFPTGTRIELDPSHIAVLYFDNLSSDPSLDYVAHGLTADLIDELSQVSALHVVSRSGVKQFRDGVVSMDSIARSLMVGTIVEGSVDLSGEQLKVTVRLIDADGARQLQSQRFERPRSDFSLLQDEIISQVARFLRERLGREILLSERRRRAPSIEAWELVQRAEEETEEVKTRWLSGDALTLRPLLERADSLLALAEEAAPNWSEPIVLRGWVALDYAEVVGQLAISASASGELTGAALLAEQETELLERGLGSAERALGIDAGDPEALTLRGTARLRFWRLGHAEQSSELLEQAERDLREAVDGNRSLPRAWMSLSRALQYRGQYAESFRAARNALEADAYLTEPRRAVDELLFAALAGGAFDEAREMCESERLNYPEGRAFLECELTILGWSGSRPQDVPEAWRLLREIEEGKPAPALLETWPFRRMMVAAVIARAGLHDSARSVIRSTRANVPSEQLLLNLAFQEAYVRLLIGDTTATLDLLDEFLSVGPQWRDLVADSPWFEPISDHPRFVELIGTGHR